MNGLASKRVGEALHCRTMNLTARETVSRILASSEHLVILDKSERFW